MRSGPFQLIVASLFLSGTVQISSLFAQADFERAPILYSKTAPTDRISELTTAAGSSKLTDKLQFSARHGYLPSLLKLLDIPPESQTLVFSKTSLQQHRISPATPRAIYFSDDVYVGWVPNGDVIEISTADPQLGGVFYTLKQSDNQRPVFQRADFKCLQCHGSTHTRRVPGHIVRSVYSDPDGLPIFRAGTFRTTDASPFSERFGGWYVTGQSGNQFHMGNQTIADSDKANDINRTVGSNRDRLDDLFDTNQYLTPHSDLIALMVLVHQVTVHNALTAANHSGRIALRDAAVMNKALERPANFVSDSTKRRIASAAEKVVDALLLANTKPFTAPISGTSRFAATFVKAGPSDKQGRSLRTLDLSTGLFRNPCSFLIYSSSFDGLPAPVREQVAIRLNAILTAEEISDDKYSHLTAKRRRAIFEILQATKPSVLSIKQPNDSATRSK